MAQQHFSALLPLTFAYADLQRGPFFLANIEESRNGFAARPNLRIRRR